MWKVFGICFVDFSVHGKRYAIFHINYNVSAHWFSILYYIYIHFDKVNDSAVGHYRWFDLVTDNTGEDACFDLVHVLQFWQYVDAFEISNWSSLVLRPKFRGISEFSRTGGAQPRSSATCGRRN